MNKVKQKRNYSKKELNKMKGCACYGNNSVHSCFCLPHNNKNKPIKTKKQMKPIKTKTKKVTAVNPLKPLNEKTFDNKDTEVKKGVDESESDEGYKERNKR